MASPRRDVYVGSQNVEDVLVAELAKLGVKRATSVAAGCVAVDATKLVDPAFARTVLPSAVEVSGAKANDVAGAVLDVAKDAGAVVVEEDARVALPLLARRGSRALRDDEHPLTSARQTLADVIGAKIAGRRAKTGDTSASSGHVVDVLIVDAWRAFVSVSKRAEGPALLAWPSGFAGGQALPEEARDSPSSAYRKLDEALAWLETAPHADDVVADLGAAPGGWTWTCLQRGAGRVYAVDRADLDAHVAADKRVTHVRADAFKWTPERMPTFVVCDVIAEPSKSLDVVRRFVASPALRALVVTLKLKKPVDLDVVAAARALCMRTPGFFGRTKHLVANKLEVSVMMRRA